MPDAENFRVFFQWMQSTLWLVVLNPSLSFVMSSIWKPKPFISRKYLPKSSGMSHLLEQTRRTAELFFAPGDSTYRQALVRVMKTHHKGVPTNWIENKPKNGDWKSLPGLSRQEQNDLPFFAKCGLARLRRETKKAGDEVSFLKV